MESQEMIYSNTNSVNVTCVHCGSVTNILVDIDDYIEWMGDSSGRYIQDIFHYLSAAERELMISQTCDNCWKKMFGEDG